ncbi:hypothetical protein BO86DRAFT_168522 [Aspergillus japonicus CBS 114.51]|uniref:Uncharacterized protein n=1 Tax=Aspergillus japonicus CBS 114.51 TaxID=1448312 RepID=A0A8T8WT37_ASPJA|nr:hypothetical protein BO86DRAFT_168522 [Aspergillus japonicus CBS 114.51]RAH79005.1 hypothetical protein BO86DRAFT_168522 [Aspergillus japonicus CBS 114.51]
MAVLQVSSRVLSLCASSSLLLSFTLSLSHSLNRLVHLCRVLPLFVHPQRRKRIDCRPSYGRPFFFVGGLIVYYRGSSWSMPFNHAAAMFQPSILVRSWYSACGISVS